MYANSVWGALYAYGSIVCTCPTSTSTWSKFQSFFTPHIRITPPALVPPPQALAKKLQAGSGTIASMAVHPTGDHLLVGCEDKRLLWFDLDLSSKPYKTLRYHDKPLRAVAYHGKYPLFASGADDAQVCVCVWGVEVVLV